jgi:hypothetical protein
MKNIYINYLKISTVTILLTVAMVKVPFGASAQQNEPQAFVLVDCLKIPFENEAKYLDFVKNTVVPIQKERIKQGTILAWYLYKVRFTGAGDTYNYVVVSLFDKPANIENPFKGLDVGKVFPGKDLNKVLTEANSMRTIVSSTLLQRQSFVYPAGGPGDFKYLQIDYMKVPQGKEGEYYDVETTVWKPIHNEFIKAGSRVGWSLWGRVFPSGASLDFQYITANYFANWSQIGAADYNDAFNKAHPGKDMNEMGDKTNASRTLVKSELWEVVERVFAQ